MERLFELRESLLRQYAKYSRYVDKVFQFIVSLSVFGFIGSNIGFLKTAANPIVTLGLSLICTFLPFALVVVLAAAVVLVQFYTLSMGIALVAAVLFAIMFILYFRFAPEKGIILLLVPVAFALKIPVVIPIIYGLIGTPVCILPIIFGTIVYYMITYVKSCAATMGGAGKADMMEQVVSFVQQIFNNKEMWMVVAALTICFLIVYNVKRLSVDNAWKIAMVSGSLIYIVVMAVGNIVMKIPVSYVVLIVGGVVSVLVALVLEFFVFAVDYSRTEHLQFEDDEYFYYVKAVPKVYVAAPEKTVKKINERKKRPKVKAVDVTQNLSDDVLLERALKEELEIQDMTKGNLKF